MAKPLKVVTLTQTDPKHQFRATPGQVIPLATSGVTDGATVKFQYRVEPTDPWVDDPNNVFSADKHLSGDIEVNAPYHQVIVENPTGLTAVNVIIGDPK